MGDELKRDRGAARARAEASDDFYIVIPTSRWGGKTATFGPMSEDEAHARLDIWVPLHAPECPPKLLRVVEDYGQDEASGEPAREAGQ